MHAARKGLWTIMLLVAATCSSESASPPTGGGSEPGTPRVDVPLGPPVAIVAAPGSPASAQNPRGQVVADPSRLPPLPDGGELAAAARFEPDGLQAPDGLAVTWPLARPRFPGSLLYVVSYHERTGRWVGTGEQAVVSDDGREAVGVVRHFSDVGLSDRPVLGASEFEYRTEWVWMLSDYDRKLDEFARRVSDRYATALKLPGGAALTTKQLQETGDVQVGGVSIASTASCLRAARSDFTSGKQRLDDKFAESFERWTNVVEPGDPLAVVTLWRTAGDLYRLANHWGVDYKAKVTIFARDSLIEAAQKKVTKLIDKIIEKIPKVKDGGIAQVLRDKVVGKVGDKVKEYAKDQVKQGLERLLVNPSRTEARELADSLMATADKHLFDFTYHLPDNARGTIDGASTVSVEYYRLSGPITREFRFHTGLGLLFGEKEMLNRKARTYEWTPGPHSVRLDDDQLEGVAEGRVGGTEYYRTVYTTTDKKLYANFPDIQFQYREWKKLFRAETDAATKEWFNVIAASERGDASDEQRFLALGAIRLLRSDVKWFIEEESIPYMIKRLAIKELAPRLLALIPGIGSLATVGPFVSLVEWLVGKGVDAIRPDDLARFPEELQIATLRAAERIRLQPKIEPVIADRFRGIEALLSVPSEKVDTCDVKVDVTGAWSLPGACVNFTQTGTKVHGDIFFSGGGKGTIDGELADGKVTFTFANPVETGTGEFVPNTASFTLRYKGTKSSGEPRLEKSSQPCVEVKLETFACTAVCFKSCKTFGLSNFGPYVPNTDENCTNHCARYEGLSIADTSIDGFTAMSSCITLRQQRDSAQGK